MKTEKNILFACILNFAFSIFEFIGGIWTGSVAILSDAIHDIGDAVSIACAFIFEKKSKKQPDERYTYGYARYSVLGSVLTVLILLVGSVAVIYKAVTKIITPTPIRYDGAIMLAIVGVCVNFIAAFLTREKGSLNQKAVNLHMLEDVLGWAVVLVGAVVMKLTGFDRIDPILSIAVAIFILINAVKNLGEALDVFLEKTPRGVDVCEIREHVQEIEGVLGVHHIHIWSMDGQNHYATMHIVTNENTVLVKQKIREELQEHGISHVTLELERENEPCEQKQCRVENVSTVRHHHHHHHHHH